MAKNQPIQTNFTAGEISPRMRGRVDIARYANGVETLQNFIVMPQGGAYRRSGSVYVSEIRDSSKAGRLLRFEFSITQVYIVQFEEYKLRFYKNGGIITMPSTIITGITAANPGVVTAPIHGLSNGDRVTISGVLGMYQVNNREFTVANKTINTFELSGVDTSAYAAYTSDGTVSKIYEVTTTYTEDEIPNLQFTQSADVLKIAHQAHKTANLSRTGHTSWTLTDIVFIDGPYLPEETAITITPSGVTGSVTLTASAALFTGVDVGRHIRMLHAASWSWATITAFTDATHVTATIGATNTVAGASTKYRLGAFYTNNYPQCIVFHEQRLVLANTPTDPQSLWLSNSGLYDTFSPTTLGTTTVTSSNGIYLTLVSNSVNAIRWLISNTSLAVGTLSSEWEIKGSTSNEGLTPTNSTLRQQSSWGSKLLQALIVGSSVLFLDRPGRKLREYLYNYTVDKFVAKDISLLGEHLLREGTSAIAGFAYQQSPDSVVWMNRTDGALVGMTYLYDQEIIGFHRHLLGGNFAGGDPVVESICTAPNLTGTADTLWALVKRTINGATVRTVEYLDDQFIPESPTDKDAMNFVDCGLTYDSTATLTITGLWHLRGETVTICADAAARSSVVVDSGGRITLAETASLIRIGLPYNSVIKPLPPEGGNPAGTAQGKMKRVNKSVVRVLDSLGLEYGKDEDHYDTLSFSDSSDPTGVAPPLFTGDKVLELDTDIDGDGTYFIRQSNPYPLTILALMPKINVSET